jgi:NADH dehydrogenase/NADH:ubiquinone oxidoreductase subunit G
MAPRSTRAWAGRATSSIPTIEGIEDADAILLIGTNPRLRGPMLNARIRKRWRMRRLQIGLIGEGRSAPTITPISAPVRKRWELADGKHKPANAESAKKPMIIIGQGALARGDGAAFSANAAKSPTLSARPRATGTASRAAHGGCPRRRSRSRLRAG